MHIPGLHTGENAGINPFALCEVKTGAGERRTLERTPGIILSRPTQWNFKRKFDSWCQNVLKRGTQAEAPPLFSTAHETLIGDRIFSQVLVGEWIARLQLQPKLLTNLPGSSKPGKKTYNK